MVLILIPLPLSAQSDNYQIGGYVKYLYSNTDSPVIGRANDHLIHNRINGRYFLTNEITASLEIRNRVFFGGSVEKVPGFVSTIRTDHYIPNTDVVWWHTGSSLGYSELDRFWIDATYEKFQLTVGRQRIAFGTALVWNPIDLFNPSSVLDFDYEERPGVDAVRLQYFSSAVSKIEIAIKPGRDSMNTVVAGQLSLNYWEYDFHFLGGFRGKEPFAGFAWAGDIKGAGFRGEYLASKINDDAVSLSPSLRGKWSNSVTLSCDYTFPNTFYIHTEALYNDRGVTSHAALSLPLMRSLNLLSPARWSLFQEFSYELHPLIHVSTFGIYNPSDKSSVFVPSTTWSVFKNFDISLFGLLFFGDPLTEYGDAGTSLVLRGKYSF